MPEVPVDEPSERDAEISAWCPWCGHGPSQCGCIKPPDGTASKTVVTVSELERLREIEVAAREVDVVFDRTSNPLEDEQIDALVRLRTALDADTGGRDRE